MAVDYPKLCSWADDNIEETLESCLRLIRALAVESHETWLEANRYLNMADLKEHKKEAPRMAA